MKLRTASQLLVFDVLARASNTIRFRDLRSCIKDRIDRGIGHHIYGPDVTLRDYVSFEIEEGRMDVHVESGRFFVYLTEEGKRHWRNSSIEEVRDAFPIRLEE